MTDTVNTTTTTTTRARTELWLAWAEIAIEAERRARAARKVAAAARGRGRSPAPALEREMKGAMETIVASAAAVESLANQLADFHPHQKWPAPAATRALAVLRESFPTVSIGSELEEGVGELFRHRNDTVHYRSEWLPLEPHPLGMSATGVAVRFSIESARRAVDVLLDYLGAATTGGENTLQDAAWWAYYWRDIRSELDARRQKPAQRRAKRA